MKFISTFFLFVLNVTLKLSFGFHIKLDSNWISQNIYFGSTQIRFPATVKLSTDLIASMENNFTTNSLTTVPDPNVDDLFYDSITIEETDFFTGYVKNNITKNELSLGWFQINSRHGITVIYNTIYDNILSRRFVKKTFSVTVMENNFCSDDTFSVHLPNTSLAENIRLCFQPGSTKVLLPSTFGPLDKTQTSCYIFPALANRKICTDTFDQTLALHNENFIFIGLESLELFVGLTLQQDKISAGPAWNELPAYANFDYFLMFGVGLYLLFWSLYFCHTNFILYTKDKKTTDKNPICNVPLSLKIFFQSGVILLISVIVYETVSNNFIFRFKYVIDDSLRSFVDIYLMFVCLALVFASLVCIYNSLQLTAPANITLQRSLFESLLTVAVATLFVGRTVLCEQSIICVLAACFWIPFQLLYLFSCKRNTAFLQIGIFLILYPFVIFSMLEPVVREIVDLNRNSWLNSQLAILIPCSITYCYVTLLKHVNVK